MTLYTERGDCEIDIIYNDNGKIVDIIISDVEYPSIRVRLSKADIVGLLENWLYEE